MEQGNMMESPDDEDNYEEGEILSQGNFPIQLPL